MNAQLELPIFASSPAMRRVLDDVTQAARSRAHVIISGEPGTGHELVAREVHRRSPSPGGPFVKAVYDPTAPDAFEFDLFGYNATESADRPERRAVERIGRGGHLHNALGGTIFFANLPAIPARIQIRLARLFRSGEAVVLQAKKRIKVTVRAIAAVEQGYEEAVRDGRLQEELFHLISGARIELPPLRRRSEDIPALASFLLSESCRGAGLPSKQLSSAAQQLLSALPWHGNAAELRRLLSELAERSRAEIIDLNDVLATIQIDGRAKQFTRGGTLREARARFEREYIVAVVEQHHGRIPEAAKTLGVQRPNLYRKLRRMNVAKISRRANARQS